MIESKIVEVDGVFVGAAILGTTHGTLAFFATHDRVRPLHGVVLPNMAAIRHQVGRYYRGTQSAAEAIALSQATLNSTCSNPPSA